MNSLAPRVRYLSAKGEACTFVDEATTDGLLGVDVLDG